MKGMKVSFAILAAASIIIGFGGMAYAFHSGGVAECEGCHSMYSPAGGMLLTKSDPSSTCLNCHEHAGDTGPSSYHISTRDADLGAGQAPKQRTPGGDFGWLKKSYSMTIRGTASVEAGQTHGHTWIYLAVLDGAGEPVFESGRLNADGSIAGNDNDADPARFEPHYAEVRSGDEVQIYEPILGAPDGRVTTVLLAATRYLKDNRVLPSGFDKATADEDIAVKGEAEKDEDFKGGGDRVRYAVSLGGAVGPFTVKAELWYQSIGFRWARNAGDLASDEAARFQVYYGEMAGSSGIVLAKAAATVT